MSVSSLALDSGWVHYVGDWSSRVEPRLAPIDKNLCYAPRLALIPSTDKQVIPSGGKIQFNFFLVSGSLIWGWWLLPGFQMQLTDLNIEHEFCQEPATTDFMITVGAQFGRFISPTLFPTPHPVVGDGLFQLEAWGPPNSVFYAVLGVAEVTKCQVR